MVKLFLVIEVQEGIKKISTSYHCYLLKLCGNSVPIILHFQ